MIKVLQNWQEIGEATLALQHKGLPAHQTAQKNWDHFQLYQAVVSRDRQARVLDLGCGEGYTLGFLHALGFRDLHGLDFRISLRLRLKQWRERWRARSPRPPYRLYRGDLTRTPFAGQSFEIAFSVSTLEHGVPVPAFLQEASRLLRPGGLLFVTTDYWEDKIPTEDSVRAFGLPWKIFCRDEIGALIGLACAQGLSLVEDGPIPPCGDRTVYWQNADYTFLALLFRKTA
jgi:SAM-dependent methyltransferase